MGTDSQAFRDKALQLHQHIQQQTLPRRPWALQTDGDVWRVYFEHATAKQVGSIAITKVKGHATQNMVDQGLVQPQDKIGNDKADEAADEGVELFGDGTVQLGKHYVDRHQQYTSSLVGDH